MDAFDGDLRGRATSLKSEKKHSFERGSLFNAILSRLEGLYKILLTGDNAAVIHEWYRLNCTIGERVSIRDQARITTGMADGLNDRGELLVRLSSGDIETVSAEDVTIVRD
jgi:BirA family biotin operon repressor/biotin-[acetyl-CoA-carboxylase] ligase